jgi:hypothetical protein
VPIRERAGPLDSPVRGTEDANETLRTQFHDHGDKTRQDEVSTRWAAVQRHQSFAPVIPAHLHQLSGVRSPTLPLVGGIAFPVGLTLGDSPSAVAKEDRSDYLSDQASPLVQVRSRGVRVQLHLSQLMAQPKVIA